VRTPRVTIIGGGAGGLAASVDLARRGVDVTLLEAAPHCGGKIRQLRPGGNIGVDAGPTVVTMRWVFEQLFQDAGVSLADYLTLHRSDILVRHTWTTGGILDLYADNEKSAAAIEAFAGKQEAQGFRDLCIRAQRAYRILEAPFIKGPRPSAIHLATGFDPREMLAASPFKTLWKALQQHFRDPRMLQLFGRYATYTGSSPFLSPATLMLIVNVEQQGVYLPEGGIISIARAMAKVAEEKGVTIRTNAPVAEILVKDGRATGVKLANGERIESDAVICAADFRALSAGLFGQAVAKSVARSKPKHRSMSAVTWALHAKTSGFDMSRHNVFFATCPQSEFTDAFQNGRLPRKPTIYVCAQDRGQPGQGPIDGPERLLVQVNAPANGDSHHYTAAEIEECTKTTFGQLETCGLTIERGTAEEIATPADFETLFPATGGALFGQAVHGSLAAFRRPGSRSALTGLYLAGGSVHPGPGVPMATLSGRQAADSLLQDLTSR
jgi:1-hydroxycarotenoid 3,4-desaturase